MRGCVVDLWVLDYEDDFMKVGFYYECVIFGVLRISCGRFDVGWELWFEVINGFKYLIVNGIGFI